MMYCWDTNQRQIMAISKGFLDCLVRYLQVAAGNSPMAIIGDQSFRCSIFDVKLCSKQTPRLLRWIESKLKAPNENPVNRGEFLKIFKINESIGFDLNGNPDVILDLSQPIPGKYVNNFRSLLEIGTLEHIMNPFQALVNFDKMVTEGGIIIHFSPIKINPNHGYYSISPQLLFDFYLSDDNYKLITAELISYYISYDSLLSPMLVTSYNLNQDLIHYRSLGFLRTLKRKLRRLSIFFSTGTYIGFVVKKISSRNRHYPTIVQHQFKSQ